MNSEAQMNAYVLLPNAVNLLLGAHEFDFEKHVGASRGAVEAVMVSLMEAKPDGMLAYLSALPKAERDILHRCLLVCLRAVDEYAFEQRLGLPKDVGGEVLELLAEASK